MSDTPSPTENNSLAPYKSPNFGGVGASGSRVRMARVAWITSYASVLLTILMVDAALRMEGGGYFGFALPSYSQRVVVGAIWFAVIGTGALSAVLCLFIGNTKQRLICLPAAIAFAGFFWRLFG